MSNTNYKIPAQNFGELQFRVEKLNKRAAKLNLPMITLKVIRAFVKEAGVAGIPKRYFEVAVEGVAPKIPGWTFLGTLEHTDHGNVLRSVPGSEIPESYRNAKRNCDHCQKIRNRKDTYVVRNEDGSVKQVGHNCIKDFLGHVDPNHLARMAEFVRDLEEASADDGFGGFGGGKVVDLTEEVLAVVYEVIKLDGWVSRGAAKAAIECCKVLRTTADIAWDHLHPSAELIRDGFRPVQPSEEAYSFVKQAVKFVKSMDAMGEYENNLKVAAHNEFVEFRGLGLLASLVPFYQKKLAKAAEKAAKMKEESKSEYFGTVSKREIFTLTVVGKNTFDGQFGTTSLYRMRDAAGNVAVWFTSTGSLEVGKTYRIKGTVKKHETYKDIAQTTLSRCKVEQELEADKVA